MAQAKSVKRKRITLKFEGEPGLEVFVAGSFNDWVIEEKDKKAKKLKEKEDGQYAINLMLPLGDHQYKFYCDESWYADPKAEEQTPNIFGTYNSLLTVA